MSERRAEFRNRTYLGGVIAFNNRSSTVNCLVRNMSATGAKLTFAHPPLVPSEFDLAIHKRGAHRAQIVWQYDTQLGVVFMGTDAWRDRPWQAEGDVVDIQDREPPVDADAQTQPDQPAFVSAGDSVVLSFDAARRRLRPS